MNKWIVKALQISVVLLALLNLSNCGRVDDSHRLYESGSPSALETIDDNSKDNTLDILITESAPDITVDSAIDSQTTESVRDSIAASDNASSSGEVLGSDESSSSGEALGSDKASHSDESSSSDGASSVEEVLRTEEVSKAEEVTSPGEVSFLDNNDNNWITESDKQTTFGTVLITGESVNVYSRASIESGMLGRVHEGVVLALMQNEEVDGFIKISYGGNPAYISAEQSVTLSGESVRVAPSGGKLIALTFDDGPNGSLTYQLLDILESESISVTFFVLGKAAQAYPDIVKRAAADGHEIGSHTWGHADLTTLSAGRILSEVDDAADIIEKTTGFKPSVTRPPYGEYNSMVLEAIETPVIMWSVDPMDWKFQDADTVYQNVVNVVKDGDIILLHDSYSTSVQAAARIIAELKSRGFTFVTVSELLEQRGSESQKVYTTFRP